VIGQTVQPACVTRPLSVNSKEIQFDDSETILRDGCRSTNGAFLTSSTEEMCWSQRGGFPMKTVLTGIVLGIVFSMELIFSNRAFASDTLPYCQYMIWKHGQYICGDLETNW
jgi:hypothetical protein